MRRLVLMLSVAGLAAAFALPAVAADPPKDAPKDTEAAAKTREILSTFKLTVDYKNEILRDVLDELAGKVKAKKLGPIKFTNAKGVSLNARFTYKADDKPLEEVLAGILGPIDRGFIVISNAKNKEDGQIQITGGKERGYPLPEKK